MGQLSLSILFLSPFHHRLLRNTDVGLPADNAKKRETLKTYIEKVILPNMPLFDYDLKSAEWHATERARLESMGQTPAFVDGQIAAITSSNQLILVTNNVSDFDIFQGLKIENWFQ